MEIPDSSVKRHGSRDAIVVEIDHAAEETVAANGNGVIEDFRLWGARRCRQTNEPPKKPRWRTGVARDFTLQRFSLRGRTPRRCGRMLPRRFFRAIDDSVMGEGEGSGGGDGGLGERSLRWGFEGAGAPRQPQCTTLGRLAPRHYAVRRRPRCPHLARRAAREGCRWRDGWLRPSCDHRTAEQADHSVFPPGGT